MTSDVVLSCDQLNKSYQVGPESVSVIHDLSFSLNKGEWISIVGASGSGKTTLLNLLGGLDDPTSGTVCWGDDNIFELKNRQLDDLRNRYLGVVYQFHHLLAEFSALENVAMPLLVAKQARSQVMAKAEAVLQQVGLGHRLQHKPAELSGGERQRVALARALVTEPALVLLDEPTGNLDEQTAKDVQQLIAKLNEELGIAFIVVTHDLKFAAQARRQFSLIQGHLEQTE
ncbi:ABC transporter ATP-binding protein [Bermanella sp. R86510]|uniref:ABC transporter ATP-binding protein n=1 Tax=unclassified Bermanella TaxID=2627862 RepID=UPI0037C8D23E